MNPQSDEHARHEVFNYFGTFSRSMISMSVVHLANWGPACRVLVDNVGEWCGGVLVAYRCTVGFAVLTVISAVFIQQTMTVAQQDTKILIMQKQKAQKRYTRHLK